MHLAGLAAAAQALPVAAQAAPADYTLEIAPYTLEASPKHRVQTVAYNSQVPGPLLRMREGKPVTLEIRNRSSDPELVHCHGLYLPTAVDGAMEEGTPMIAPGAMVRYAFTPEPAGFRWYHTHTFAGKNLRKAQYGAQHGFLMIDGAEPLATFDQEIFLALHDWAGYMMASDDGAVMPVYDFSTINGKMLGHGEPLRVKVGQRVLLHVLNSSPTEVHWLALPGHRFKVLALDGNPVPVQATVDALRLAPGERISALVELNAPGVWVLGELQPKVQAAGMGMVVEYAGATGGPKWVQPKNYEWDYSHFAQPYDFKQALRENDVAIEIPLEFNSKFRGHGSPEQWTINGKSYPHTDEPILQAGQRYRLVMKNLSSDNHPIHLHRHTFEVVSTGGENVGRHLMKDVLLIPAKSTSMVEFVANHPDPSSVGRTLFHCHQQDHMDNGFMMSFRYA